MLQGMQAFARTPASYRSLRHFTTFHLRERVFFPSYYPSLKIRRGKESPNSHYVLQPTSPGTSFTASALEVPYPDSSMAFEVHRGTLSMPSTDPSNQSGLQEIPDVLLRLFRPKVDERSNVEDKDESSKLTDGSILAWEEVWSLSKLSELQGSVVPMYYGTFVVRCGDPEEELFAVAVSHVKGVSLYDRFMEWGGTNDFDTRWYSLARTIFSQIYDFHQRGVCGIDTDYPNILVIDPPAEPHPPQAHPSSKIPLHFKDLSTGYPIAFPPNDKADNDEPDEQCLAGEMRRKDVRYFDDTLITMCFECWQFLYKGLRRQWAFYNWMMAEHPEDAWFQVWWEPYLKDDRRRCDPIPMFYLQRRRVLEDRGLLNQKGEEGTRAMDRVRARWKQQREVKFWKKILVHWRDNARNAAFNDQVCDKALEDLGEPLWKVLWLRRFLRGNVDLDIENKKRFKMIREMCPNLLSNAPGSYWLKYFDGSRPPGLRVSRETVYRVGIKKKRRSVRGVLLKGLRG